MKKIVLGLFAAALVLQVNAQETKLAVKMAKGDKYSMEQKTVSKSTVEFGGQSMETNIDISTGQEIEVTDFADGKYTLSVINKGIIAKVKGMMGEMEMNSNDGSGFDNFPNGMPKSLKQSANLKYVLVIDQTGKMISATGFEKLSKPSEEDEGMLKMMMGGEGNITDSAIIKTTMSLFKLAQKGTLKTGDTWDDIKKEKKTENKQTFVVASVNDTEVSVNVNGKNKVNTTSSMMGQEAEITGDATNNGNALVNVATGILKSSTINSSTKLTINANGNEIPQSSESTLIVTVTKK